MPAQRLSISACSIVVNKFRSKRTVGQAAMTLALLGQNLYKYLSYNLILSNTFQVAFYLD